MNLRVKFVNNTLNSGRNVRELRFYTSWDDVACLRDGYVDVIVEILLLGANIENVNVISLAFVFVNKVHLREDTFLFGKDTICVFFVQMIRI